MATKEFTISQIAKKVDALYDFLSERELKLSNDFNSVDKLNDAYDDIDQLGKKIGKLRTLFQNSVTGVLDQKQNAVLAEAMLTMKPDELVALSQKLQARKQKSESSVEDQSAPTYTNPSQNDALDNSQNMPM